MISDTACASMNRRASDPIPRSGSCRGILVQDKGLRRSWRYGEWVRGDPGGDTLLGLGLSCWVGLVAFSSGPNPNQCLHFLRVRRFWASCARPRPGARHFWCFQLLSRWFSSSSNLVDDDLVIGTGCLDGKGKSFQPTFFATIRCIVDWCNAMTTSDARSPNVDAELCVIFIHGEIHTN
jgi:hypothetical protein